MLVIDEIRKRIEFEKWLKNYPNELLERYSCTKKQLRILCSKLQVREFAFISRRSCYYRNYERYSDYELRKIMYDLDWIKEEIVWIYRDIQFHIREYIFRLKWI